METRFSFIFRIMGGTADGENNRRIWQLKGEPQERFLATSADICIYGGSSGRRQDFRVAFGADPAHEQQKLQCGYLPKQLHTGHISWWFVG